VFIFIRSDTALYQGTEKCSRSLVYKPQFTYFKKFLVATQLDKDIFPCNFNSVHNLPAIYSILLLFYHLLWDITDTSWQEASETKIWMQIFFILCLLHSHPTLLTTIF